jgi:hypothetical protein
MPFFYDLQNSFTTSGTPLTEVRGDWTLFYETGSFVSPTYTFRVWRPS